VVLPVPIFSCVDTHRPTFSPMMRINFAFSWVHYETGVYHVLAHLQRICSFDSSPLLRSRGVSVLICRVLPLIDQFRETRLSKKALSLGILPEQRLSSISLPLLGGKFLLQHLIQRVFIPDPQFNIMMLAMTVPFVSKFLHALVIPSLDLVHLSKV
jgi:hypothetical protein